MASSEAVVLGRRAEVMVSGKVSTQRQSTGDAGLTALYALWSEINVARQLAKRRALV